MVLAIAGAVERVKVCLGEGEEPLNWGLVKYLHAFKKMVENIPRRAGWRAVFGGLCIGQEA